MGEGDSLVDMGGLISMMNYERNASETASITSTTGIWDEPCGEREGGGARPFINVQCIVQQQDNSQVNTDLVGAEEGNDFVDRLVELKEDYADLEADGPISVVSDVVRADSGKDID